MIRNKMRSMMWNKVDESVLPVEGQIDQSDNIVSQAKGGINSLGKEQLPGQDCGCTNSGDGGAGDWSAICDCVVGKSGGTFHKNSSHESLKTVSDSLPLMSSREIANTGPNNGRDRNNEFDFGSGIRENSMLGNCIQAIDMNCVCPCQETQLLDLNLTEMCTSAHFSENDLNGGELIPAKPDVVMDEHYKDASWAYLIDEAEKDYVLETMASCGPTTVSQHIHGKVPLTQRLRTTNLESTVITTTSVCPLIGHAVSADLPDIRLSRELQVRLQPRCKQSPMHRSHPQTTVSRPEYRSLQFQVEHVFLLTAQI
ncbi:hypothetical protein BgiBS90_020790 [Biomphalaria glabrata]|nr:hypothetical protein BgiBS90_020790 [Biomphalaria glabrata]